MLNKQFVDENIISIYGELNTKHNIKADFDEQSIIKKEYKVVTNPNPIPADIMAQMIDHTILRADAKFSAVDLICNEAIKYNFKSVCVNSYFIKRCNEQLKNSKVSICTVIDFPLGNGIFTSNVEQSKAALKDGADELDMVINISALTNKDYSEVYKGIKLINDLKVNNSFVLKVIIETCLLSTLDKIAACIIAKAAGADFVKTSTGFSTGGAEIEDVALMKYIVGDNMFVKASGGVRSKEKAELMVANGASRIGTSSGIAIIEGIE